MIDNKQDNENMEYEANASCPLRGIRSILSSSASNYESLPMLDIVFDRMVRFLSTSLRNLTQNNIDVSLKEITAMRFGEYLDTLPSSTLSSVFKAEEWNNFGILSTSSDFIYNIIDTLLGGSSQQKTQKADRPYTTIELNLAKEIIELTLNDLSTAFDPVASINFSFERLETNPKFAAITRLSNPVVVAKLNVDMENSNGVIEIAIPYTTLEPAKEVLQQLFIGERYGKDITWEKFLARKLWSTDVELKVVIKEKKVNLAEIMKWEKGSFLPLDIYPNDPIHILCAEVPMFDGIMGRKNDKVVVKIKGKYIKDE